MVESFPPQKQT